MPAKRINFGVGSTFGGVKSPVVGVRLSAGYYQPIAVAERH